MQAVFGFASGLLLGIGLIVSGMSNPAKVLNFLDLAGTFDPSLAFVMAGAVAVTFAGYKYVLRLPHPAFDAKFHIPQKRTIDARLATGAILFGIGWGLAGLCPGPALTALPFGSKSTLVFVAAMVLGMLVATMLARRHAAAPSAPSHGADRAGKPG